MADRSVTPAQLNALLADYQAELLPQMRQAALAWAFVAARHAVNEKLSGQYLKRQTGTLQRSVTASPDASIQNAGIEGSFGTSLDYGVAHEQGFDGPVAVRAHERLGRPVRAHERMAHIRARWYLRDSFEEKYDTLQRIVDEASSILLATSKVASAGSLIAKGGS